MSPWKSFLTDDVIDPTGKPGKVMICFVNTFLEGLDGVKYKFLVDRKLGISGITTEEKYCFELAPITFTPIETYVWSRVKKRYKKLDDVVPRKGRKLLVRKRLDTFKVKGTLQKHPTARIAVPPPKKPAPAPPPGPSPTGNQGTRPTSNTRDENGAPLSQHERPVPGQITKEQLHKIFPKGSLAHLQKIADICNKDLAKYQLGTVLRKAHFFGQIRQETGSAFNGFTENLNYTPYGLKNTFSYYRKHPEEAEQDGRHYAMKDGEKIKIPANQEAIADKHYGPLAKGKNLGNTERGDG